MATSQTKLPDEKFYDIQMKLRKWMRAKGFVRWRHIQKACGDLLSTETEEYAALYGNSPEYRLFMPLLRNGTCEVAWKDGKLGYIILLDGIDKSLEDVSIDPLLLLNNFPSVRELVAGFKEEDSLRTNFICDLQDSYKYKPYKSGKLKVGIYKPMDEVYSPALLFDGKVTRLIPGYEESPDAICTARCFVRSCEGQKLFVYHASSKTLNVSYYSELPVLVTRALVLFCPKQIIAQKYNYPLSCELPYKDISREAVDELIRIFGIDCTEVKDD